MLWNQGQETRLSERCYLQSKRIGREFQCITLLNVIDLNRVSDPFGIRQAGVKIRRGDLNLLILRRNQDSRDLEAGAK